MTWWLGGFATRPEGGDMRCLSGQLCAACATGLRYWESRVWFPGPSGAESAWDQGDRESCTLQVKCSRLRYSCRQFQRCRQQVIRCYIEELVRILRTHFSLEIVQENVLKSNSREQLPKHSAACSISRGSFLQQNNEIMALHFQWDRNLATRAR